MILEIDRLSVAYEDGKLINNNINLAVDKGEIFCIVGESGSGKTTLLKTILGARQSSMKVLSGRVLLNTKNVLELTNSELRKVLGKEIALVPQNPAASFNPIRKYRQQIKEALISHNIKYDEKSIIENFAKLGLKDAKRVLDSCPYEMSGGMNQRIAIAVAMLLEPSILLCDEATSALDISTQEKVIRELLKLRDKSNTAIVFITHNINLATKIGDKMAIMNSGKIVEMDTINEILKNPKHIYTKALFEDTPKLNLSIREKEKNTKEIVNIKQVSKKYKKNNNAFDVLKNISFSLKEGEILAIVGESGSGKSTLLRQIACLENPDKGEIDILGEKMENKSPRQAAKYLQVVFQDPISSFDPHLSIESSLHETIHHFYEREKKEDIFHILKNIFIKDKCCSYDHIGDMRVDDIIKDLLVEMNLDENLIKRYPKNLSGGQCQRMAILRAISTKPKILLLDEATSSLDVSSQKQIIQILMSLREKYKLSIIFVSHDLALVSEFCDKILLMKDGEVLEFGDKKDLLLNPQNKYTKELLSYVK